jgi:hypothetical protein
LQVKIAERDEIVEVEFYFRDVDGAYALGRLYPRPDTELWKASYETVWSCAQPYKFVVVPVKSVASVVAMVPHRARGEGHFFLIEKPGADIVELVGEDEEDDE